MSGWISEILLFAGLIAVGQFSPGPDMVLLTQTSLRHGRGAGWWTAAGITTGLMGHAAFALTGLHWIARIHPMVWTVLQTVAGTYLLWLAWCLCRREGQSAVSPHPPPPPAGFYRRGLLCNLLNPKVLLFFGAVVTPFLGSGRPAWWPWLLWAVLVGEGLVLWGVWVAILQHRAVRSAYARCSRGVNLAFSMLMAGLALRLWWEAGSLLWARQAG